MAALVALMIGVAGCGAEDTSAVQSCSFHSDCPVGTSCNYEGKCIVAACSNCENEPSLICLKTEEHPEGVCSPPECAVDDDCDTAAGETCQDGVCSAGNANNGQDECTSNDDCADGEKCNLENKCVPDDSQGCTTNDDCADGEYCDQDSGQCATGECNDSTECADGETCDENNQCVDPCGGCPTGETCNTTTNQCEPTDPCGGCPSGETCNTTTNQCEATQACDPACTDGKVCDTSTGTCVENTCPVGSPSPQDCAADPVYNKFDPDGCFCAQCLTDSDCDTAAGETCNSNGECFACAEACDPSQGGNACSQEGFYCVSNCCVECIGNADCPQGEVCVDGACGPPPDCSQDPTLCTGGMVCNQQTGTCETPQTGSQCSAPGDCPTGQFCNTQTGQCESLNPGGGGGTCDPATTMCNPDCTCPGNSTCELGMLCTGCQPFQGDCPQGQICFVNVCIAF